MRDHFCGYVRENGDVGARNHVAVLPTIGCANELAFDIARRVKGAVPLLNNHACIRAGEDAMRARRTLVGMGASANVHSVLVVGLGCEPILPGWLAAEIAQTGKRAEYVSLEELGRYERVVEEGEKKLAALMAEAGAAERVPCGLDKLTVGIKCGGSGAVSAIASNPAVGHAADMLIDSGGTVIFTETAELIGAEHVLASRARTPEIADKLLGCVRAMRESIAAYGVDILGSEPTPGNIKNGLTTLEEKSLGAIIKGGSRPLEGVLNYGERPGKSGGLYFMDGTTQASQLFLGMLCAGAQVQIFSFAGGLPARMRGLPSYPPGLRVLPVVKVLGSCEDEDEKEYFDIYAGGILKGLSTISQVGESILDAIVDIASGRLCVTERRTTYDEMLQVYANGLLM